MPWSSRWAKRVRPGRCCACWRNLLGLPGFEFESAQEVLVAARGAQDAQASHVQGGKLSNAHRRPPSSCPPPRARPVTAAIYQLDSIVRRAPSLQLTADAARRAGRGVPA